MDAESSDQLELVKARADELSAAPFFPAIEEEVERGEITHRRYTAERLYSQKPEKFQAIVHWLAQPEHYGLLRIAKLVGVHHMTVAAVRDLYTSSVDIEKARLAKLCKTGAELCLERIIEEVPSLPANTLGLTAAQLIDKYQLLTGGATSRIEDGRKPGVLTHEEFNKMLEGLPKADAHVIEPGMGLVAEDISANAGAAGAGSDALPGVPPSPSATAPSDSQSPVLPCENANATADATASGSQELPPAHPSNPTSQPPRGGGGLHSEPPPHEALG